MADTLRVLDDAYLKPGTAVLDLFSVDANQGLSNLEAQRRLQAVGTNEIPRDEPWVILRFFTDRLRDVLVLILLVAAIISILLGHASDAIIIGLAIAIDVGLGVTHVWRTEHTLRRLREEVQSTVTVVRDGRSTLISSVQLVPGDIIEFRAGQKIPADARLLAASGLRLNEAALTGESQDAEKRTAALASRTPVSNRVNMVFAGTVVVNGTGKAVITATGTRSEFGKIAQILKAEKSPPSPLRRKLQALGIRIGWIIIGATAVLSSIGIATGASPAETLRIAITLIVSAIPEDLTVILTLALTVGVARLLKRGGVVREVAAAETLGAATVICTDKTGTLTRGEMTAVRLDFLQGTVLPVALTEMSALPRDPLHQLALIGLALASDAHRTAPDRLEYVGSATERSSLAFAERFGLEKSQLQHQWRQRDELSFDTQWKYRASLHNDPRHGTQTLFVAGAPDVLLEHSSQILDRHNQPTELTAALRFRRHRTIAALAGEGNRLLAVAVRRHAHMRELKRADVDGLLFLGVLVIQDPIRPDVSAALREAQAAGVRVIMVTGDHEATARAVARAVGLPAHEDTALSGELMTDMSDAELRQRIPSVTIFSRVTPLDKQRIVRALQAHRAVVAMTGDGINDAVALKVADIGVAMGSGKDIAKDAADLVLLNNSFSTIVAAIREGRVIRDNVRKVVAFLLSTNAAEVAIFFVSLLLGLPLPLLPAQILWINLVTDGTSDIALALEPAESGVMKRKPEDSNESLLHGQWTSIAYAGAIMTAATMGLYWYLLRYLESDLAYARTMAFAFLAVASLLSVWSYRSLQQSMFQRGFTQNISIIFSAGFSALLQVGAIYLPGLQRFFGTVPLSGRDWLVIGAVAILTVLMIDARKVLLAGVRKRRRAGGRLDLVASKRAISALPV